MIFHETPSRLSRALNLLGVLVLAFFLIREAVPYVPVWVAVLAFVALAAWFVVNLVPRDAEGRLQLLATALLVIMVVAGSITTFPTNGLTIVPTAVAIMQAFSNLLRPYRHGIALALLAALLVPAGGLIVTAVTPLSLFAVESGIVVAVLAGVSRRQFRTAERQSRLLLEERVEKQEERALAAALSERQAIARDIHDVLAHSLGGLVIQLDAVDALLDAGRTADAAGRVRDARELAASGLSEARRAVDALRDPRGGTGSAAGGSESGAAADAAAGAVLHPGAELMASLDDLVRAHRALGGSIDFDVSGTPPDLTVDEAHALRRALQEALTNARKHAADVPVSATLRCSDGSIELEVVNPLGQKTGPAAGASALNAGAPALRSGGHGLTGMAERFAELPHGSVSARAIGDRFVVRATVARS